jgi:hypothetical protein
VNTFGFRQEDIRQLLNANATTRAVLQAFREHLVAQSKPGDVAVFVYVGHGTQVVDLNGDEDDGLDEAFCTYDYDWQNPETWLTDDDLSTLLHEMQTDKVLVINCACHSGTSTRALESSGPETPYIFSINSGFTPKPNSPVEHPQGSPNPRHVLLAACRADEVSWGSARGSNFLAALSTGLNSLRRDTTFAALIGQIAPSLEKVSRSNAVSQGIHPETSVPQAEGEVTGRVREYLTPQAPPISAPTPSPPAPAPTRWQSRSGDIALDLDTDKPVYQEGDLMRVSLTADHDCHVRIYYLSADHKVHQIFPNQFQTDGLVKKGEGMSVPGPKADFEFRMSAPFGNEILMAVASTASFTDETGQRLQDQLFQEFRSINLEALGQRGIDVKGPEVLTGRALKIYRVVPEKR